MSLNFDVTATDRVGGYSSLLPLIELNALYAASTWTAVFGIVNATLNVQIDITHIPSDTADGASATSVFLFSQNGIEYWQQGALSEIRTGVDPNGSAPDINIRIDPDYIATWLYFDPNPTPTSPVPAGKVDSVEVFQHEFAHAFAFSSFLDPSTGVPVSNDMSAYDLFVKIVGGVPYFTGPLAEAVYGGPVPLTVGGLAHVGNVSGLPGADLTDDIMYGPFGATGKTKGLSALDIAILQDTYSIVTISDDLVFQHNTTGGLYGWELNASGILAGGGLGLPGPTWHAADASGDYNGDGIDDIIFQNTTNGEVYLWLQNGFAISSQSSLGVPGVAWQIVASGDINGDGNDDLLFQNTGTGEFYAWEQNGLTTLATASLGVPGTQWALHVAADLDGNGRDELIFQNTGPTGEVYVWQQDGLATTGSFSLGSPAAAWEIQGSGDFDDNGHEDIVFQNANTGEVYIWLINSGGTGILSQGSAGFANGWSIVGTGDYNGDNLSDLAFQHDATGAVYIWHMGGTTILSGQDLGLASGWSIV